ncbi:MAG: AAA family ATPase [Thiobacillus sp.]|nr:AAA family ATPase [Thiobacillus sp.]
MRIETLEITNFKAFETRRFSFHPEFNLIVGINGTGKSSLLDALSVAAGSWFLGLRGYDSRHISHEEARLASYSFDDEITFEAQYPVKIKATGEVAAQKLTWERSLESSAGKTHFRHASGIKLIAAQFDQNVRDGAQVLLPLISYYGTGRLWQEPRAESQVKGAQRLVGKKVTSRLDGYLNSVTPRISTRELVLWIARQSWAGYQQGKESPIFQAVKNAMISCVEGAENLYFDPKRGEVVVVMKNKRGTQPFFNLSDGQRCMLAMVGDIAQKAAKLNPHLGRDVLKETSGLVLIDELDLHLHPRWQRRVASDLRRVFPKIQFICTTHSPQLLGQVKAEEVILLDSIEGEHPPQTFGMDSNWLLRHVMGASERDPEVSSKLDEIFESIESNNFSKAQKQVNDFRSSIGEHPDLVEAQALIGRYNNKK